MNGGYVPEWRICSVKFRERRICSVSRRAFPRWCCSPRISVLVLQSFSFQRSLSLFCLNISCKSVDKQSSFASLRSCMSCLSCILKSVENISCKSVKKTDRTIVFRGKWMSSRDIFMRSVATHGRLEMDCGSNLRVHYGWGGDTCIVSCLYQHCCRFAISGV